MSTVSVTAEVDVDEVLSECSNKQLIDELKSRGVSLRQAIGSDEVADFTSKISSVIRGASISEALDLLSDILIAIRPEKVTAKIHSAYTSALKNRDPKTGRPVIQ